MTDIKQEMIDRNIKKGQYATAVCLACCAFCHRKEEKVECPIQMYCGPYMKINLQDYEMANRIAKKWITEKGENMYE